MSIRHGGPAISAAVVLVLLTLPPVSSLGQTDTDQREKCTAIADADIQRTAAGTTPSLKSFPVVVHYMKQESEGGRPGQSEARKLFPLNEVKAFFAENGAFNRVWWKKHRKVMFVLVGVETCPFRVLTPPPNDDLMQEVGLLYNVRKYVLAHRLQGFTGLDLYLWAGINEDEDRGVQFAGFARSAAAMTKPSVWLAPDCRQGQSICDIKFGHEVGHFFGLCHVCTNGGSPPNPDTCRQTCPLAAGAGKRLLSCGTPDPQLMADQEGSDLAPCELSFAVNNAANILSPAVH